MIEFALGQPLVLFIINQKNFNHFCQPLRAPKSFKA